jgi:hypothetical protein
VKFNSVFFFCVLLCLTLGSLSCAESKNAQLDRKLLDLTARVSERITTKHCSEKNLSEADCSEVKARYLKGMSEAVQESINVLNEGCKKSALLEDECVEQKQVLVKEMFAEYEK